MAVSCEPEVAQMLAKIHGSMLIDFILYGNVCRMLNMLWANIIAKMSQKTFAFSRS